MIGQLQCLYQAMLGCDVKVYFPVLFYKRNRKWRLCVYTTWCKPRIWKYLCKPSCDVMWCDVMWCDVMWCEKYMMKISKTLYKYNILIYYCTPLQIIVQSNVTSHSNILRCRIAKYWTAILGQVTHTRYSLVKIAGLFVSYNKHIFKY